MVELRCTICKKPVGSDAPAPFCSARCRQIDLGQWLSGRYVIAGEKHVDEAYAPPASDDDDE